ncbi:hypothetical protein Dda_7287 [Drechslerella dactyloides]|uniref:Uncharacterized protein n=1 Tax=Drechslerella dactyloides TaxID=74499 RepID=A0AAD6IW62_DREDA|nr:hypothetical protein Dda_7287 [Drechslerella dactyloides]
MATSLSSLGSRMKTKLLSTRNHPLKHGGCRLDIANSPPANRNPILEVEKSRTGTNPPSGIPISPGT